MAVSRSAADKSILVQISRIHPPQNTHTTASESISFPQCLQNFVAMTVLLLSINKLAEHRK
jgi:hypothetical protein